MVQHHDIPMPITVTGNVVTVVHCAHQVERTRTARGFVELCGVVGGERRSTVPLVRVHVLARAAQHTRE